MGVDCEHSHSEGRPKALVRLRAQRRPDGTLDAARKDEKRRRLVGLEAALRVHQWVPVGVGSAFASVAHKLHSLLHSARLFNFSWGHVSALMQSVVACCTDFGVESLMSSQKQFKLRNLFPWTASDDGFNFTGSSRLIDLPVRTYFFRVTDKPRLL